MMNIIKVKKIGLTLFTSYSFLVIAGCQHTVHHQSVNNAFIKQTISTPQYTSEAKLKFDNTPIIHENCLNQCPTGTDKTNIVVNHDVIVLSANITTKFADWVAYKVNINYITGPKRKRYWSKDPVIDAAFTLTPKDYQGLSAAPYDYDRGHQAPLAAFKGHDKWYVVNYLSNITPQKKFLNQGSWNTLESKERLLAKNEEDVYVLTGPYYEDMQPMEGPQHRRIDYIIPSGYWKIIALKSSEGVQSLGFIFPQNTPKNADYCNYIRPIDNIEAITHLHFYNDNTSENTLAEKLQCSVEAKVH